MGIRSVIALPESITILSPLHLLDINKFNTRLKYRRYKYYQIKQII